jgi:hypothetical protein
VTNPQQPPFVCRRCGNSIYFYDEWYTEQCIDEHHSHDLPWPEINLLPRMETNKQE